MGRLFQDIELTLTTSSGGASGNFNVSTTRGTLKYFYVKPATETTTWDLKIIDDKDRVVRHYKTELGTLRDVEELPVYGVYTFTLENSTRDELFTIFGRVEQET